MAIKDLRLITTHFFLCNGESCKRLGAVETTVAVRSAIAKYGLAEKVHTTKTQCNGRCKDGPVIISQPDGCWFKNILPEEAEKFVADYLIHGRPPREKILYIYGSDIVNANDPLDVCRKL